MLRGTFTYTGLSGEAAFLLLNLQVNLIRVLSLLTYVSA